MKLYFLLQEGCFQIHFSVTSLQLQVSQISLTSVSSREQENTLPSEVPPDENNFRRGMLKCIYKKQAQLLHFYIALNLSMLNFTFNKCPSNKYQNW